MLARRPIVRGDIVLAQYPYTDLSATKRRPAAVVWADPSQVDFTLAFISSQNPGIASLGEVVILPGHPEFAATGLLVPSRIRAAKLVTLSRTLMSRRLGYLGPNLTDELDHALTLALGINTLPYREEGRQVERNRLTSIHATSGTAAILTDLGLPTP